ncbi:MAG: serine/threonine-protein kinase PknK [Deltaproteobacteria bacterium]|nr:MAG: serine/threonine-protein kinase PknK [Deltaproteobacteria bacterium]
MLGRGGMGIVWLAWDRERQQEVALKRMNDLRPDQLRRFKNGFRALQDIRHPGLARMFELGTDDEGPYLVMEPIHGVDLLTYVHGPGEITFAPPPPELTDPDRSTSRVFHGTEPIQLAEIRALRAQTGPIVVTDRRPVQRRPIDSEAGLALTQPIAPGEARHPGSSGSASTGTLRSRPLSVDHRRERRSSGTESIERPPLNLARLAHVLPQLLEALLALHAHGQIHRDLKPRNVLVDGTGTLKLLDFGVVAESGRPLQGTLCGTIGYIAPEEFGGSPPGPASDRYALGAILFRMFSGRAPFEGSRAEVLRQTLRSRPPLLEDIAPWTPVNVGILVDQLLHPVPAERPGGAEIAAVFRRELGMRPIQTERRDATRLLDDGQQTAHQLLRHVRAGDDQPRLTLLTGPRDSGKRLALRRLATLAEQQGWCILSGRATPDDRVPYSALDGVVDSLSLTLRTDPDDLTDPLPPEVLAARHVLAHLFPVLRDDTFRRLDPPPDRPAIVAALLTCLGHLAERHAGALIILHDVHLVDGDCELLLEAVLRNPPQGLRIVASTVPGIFSGGAPNDHDQAVPLLRLLVRSQSGLARPVPLAPPSVDAIAHRIARAIRQPEAHNAPRVRALARACQGHPRLAILAGRLLPHLPADNLPTDLWRAWVDHALPRITDQALDVLSLVTVADHPLTTDTVHACTGLDPTVVREAIELLRDAALADVDAGSRPGPRLGVASPHLRPPLLDALAPARLQRARRALIEHLEHAHARNLPRLIRLYLDEGRTLDAQRAARAAAEDARQRLAWDFAAEMFALAADNPELSDEERAHLIIERARCHDANGLYDEAAELWSRAATFSGLPRDIARTARRGRAIAQLAAGRAEDVARDLPGLRLGRDDSPPILQRLRSMWAKTLFLTGAPASRWWRDVTGGLRLGPAHSEETEREGTLDIRLAGLVLFHDPEQGMVLLIRLMRRQARSRSAGPFSYGLALLAFIASHTDRTPKGLRRARLYRQAARRITELADEQARTDTLLLDRFLEGHLALRSGHWSEAIAHFSAVDQALQTIGHGPTFDRALVWIQRGQALQCNQNPALLQDHNQRLRHVFTRVDSRAILGHADLLDAALARWRGSPDAARQLLDHWLHRPPDDLQHTQDVYGACCAHLARTTLDHDALGTDLPRLHETLDVARRRGLERRAGFHFIAGPAALAEAAAVRLGLRIAEPRRARRLARIARHSPPGHHGPAHRALAYLHDAAGRPERALEHLRAAEESALRHEQPLDVAIARHQLGRRLGGDAGLALSARARETFRQAGAAEALLDEDPREPA